MNYNFTYTNCLSLYLVFHLESLENMEDQNIKIICFPTFKGHCGCILFDIAEIEFIKNSDKTDMALNYYLISKTEKTDIE